MAADECSEEGEERAKIYLPLQSRITPEINICIGNGITTTRTIQCRENLLTSDLLKFVQWTTAGPGSE